MNPQDPVSPQTTPAGGSPEPTPSPVPVQSVPPAPATTQPSPAPGTPNGNFPAQMPAAKKNKKKAVISTILGSVAFVVFIAVLIIMPRFQSVALETYSNDQFSLQAPKDYEKTESEGSVTFEEKDEDEGTKSSVDAYVEEFPEKMDASQQKEMLASMETGLKESLEESAKTEDNDVEEYKAESTTFKNNTALMITATIRGDGNTAGRIKVVIGVTDTKLYMVAVNAHQTDRGVTNSMDKIINSFELK